MTDSLYMSVAYITTEALIALKVKHMKALMSIQYLYVCRNKCIELTYTFTA